MTPHDTALSKVKIQLMSRPDSAFFTTLCFSLKHVWDDAIPTACTDGRTIRLNTQFFMSLDQEERLFLLLHETLHVAYLHMVRLETRNAKKFNMAADHVINLQLIDRGFKMPKMGLADRAFIGKTTEEVYNLIPDSDCQDFDMDLEPASDGTTEEDIQDIIVRAAVQSKMANDKPGTIPGEIEIFLDRLLNPKLPWNRILQKYLRTFAKNDYTFKKPNRRFFPKYHLPSLYSENLMDIAIAIDASGSVTDHDFNRFVTETHSILRMMKPEKITLIQFDTQIISVNEIRNVNQLMQCEFKGRGGTDIHPVLQWANEKKPQLLLVFSDGEFYFSDEKTKVETLWLIHDNERFHAPFGKVIHYSAAEPITQ